MITLFVVGMIGELLCYVPGIRNFSWYFAVLLTAWVSFTSTSLVLEQLSVVSLAIALVSVFRVINLLRIAQKRIDIRHLWSITRRTGVVLMSVQIPLLYLLYRAYNPKLEDALTVLAFTQILAAALILLNAIRTIIKTKPQPNLEFYSDKELPTITVAVPARNETQDLEECIASLIANDYPKLEIIVLDDCSQDRTPDIIRSFAHDGVRFIRGAEPDDRWLPKNHAYQRLYEEATGKYVLFCGVDVRFGPGAIRGLVTMLMNRDKDMLSVMPLRAASTPSSALIQPMRYWWELALPRRLFNRPAVLSTCWLIRRKALKQLGGFQAVSRAIIPEGYFARELVKTDKYSFVRANKSMEITTLKSVKEQRNTALRVRYPQLHRRPEMVLLLILAEAMLLAGPFVSLLLLRANPLIASLSAISAVLLLTTHVLIVRITDQTNTLNALINFPLVLLYEIAITLISMSKYEFGTVDWKDRNVCIPAMRVIPKLPELK